MILLKILKNCLMKVFILERYCSDGIRSMAVDSLSAACAAISQLDSDDEKLVIQPYSVISINDILKDVQSK